MLLAQQPLATQKWIQAFSQMFQDYPPPGTGHDSVIGQSTQPVTNNSNDPYA